MDARMHKSALLTSSTKNDVLRSGGDVSITGLNVFKAGSLLAVDHRIYKAEVRQLVTIDVASLTYAASKVYTILAGNTRHGLEGGQSSLRKYSYSSPADITGLTSEEVVDALIARINDQTGNFITATKTDADTFTIQDDAGYYPARPATRVGATQYKLVDDLKSGTGATIVITTAGVPGYGVGTRMLEDKPATDKMTGNLVTGEWDFPENNDPVAAQFYDGFYVTYGVDASHNAVSGLHAKKILRQLIWVDEGTGTSTSNLAGYKAFLREFERLIYEQYENDPSSMIEFFEQTAILSDNDGIGVPTSGDNAENLVNIGKNQFRYITEGATGADPAGSNLANGFNLERGSENSTDGIEMSAEIGALAPQEFIVGKQECSFRIEFAIEDVSGSDDFAVGFRKKEAYQGVTDAYDEAAWLGWDAAADPADIDINTIINDGTTTVTDTTVNLADTVTTVWEIRVDLDGLATFFIDDVEVTGVLAADFNFDADEVLIPFIHLTSSANLAGYIYVKKWFSIAAILKR